MVHSLRAPLWGMKKPLGKLDLLISKGFGEPQEEREHKGEGLAEGIFSTLDSSRSGWDSQEAQAWTSTEEGSLAEALPCASLGADRCSHGINILIIYP